MWLLNILKNLFSKKLKKRGKGLIDSPTDYRDVLLESLFTKEIELPENYRIPYALDIKDQGNTSMCVGYTCALIKEEKERREQNYVNFDPVWIYKECKKIDGIPNFKGTYLRSGLKVLLKKGAKAENDDDYEKYRIGGYVRLKKITFDNIKRAIYEYGTLLTGFIGNNEGWQTAYIQQPKSEKNLWGHAVALIGFNKNYIIGQNHWNEKWGNKGYFYIDKNYLPFEAWAELVDLPNNWKELLGENKDKPNHEFNTNLWIGMVNDEVKALQDCLKYEGCFSLDIKSSGYFGKITLSAVKCFQMRYNIEPSSGYFGPLSRSKMNELFNK